MNPQYFLYRLTLAEAKDFIKGQDRRYRQSWMQTRCICQSNGADPDGEWKFPWEEDYEEPQKPMTEEQRKKELEHMKQTALKYKAEHPELFNKTDNGSKMADTVQGA